MRITFLYFSLCFFSTQLSGQVPSDLLSEFSLESPELRENILRNGQDIISRGLAELKSVDPHEDPHTYTSLCVLIAYAYTSRGLPDSTEVWSRWLDDPAFQEIEYPERMIGLFARTGILQRKKIGIEGLRQIMVAQQIAEKHGDEYNQSLAQAYRGISLLARGIERDGFSLLEASIERFEELGFHKHALNYRSNLAAFYLRAGLYHEALDILEYLNALPKDQMTSEFRSFASSNAALSYIRLGLLEKADSLITTGLTIAEEANFKLGILYALNLRINYLIESGRWDEVKPVFRELNGRDSANYIKKVYDLRSYSALLYGRYYEHQKEYNSAKQLFLEAARYSTPGSKFPEFGKAYEGLHRVSIAVGDQKEAVRVFSDLSRIRDSLLADRIQVGLELNEVESKLESQTEQLEDKKQELEDQTLSRQRLLVALIGISLLFVISFLIYRNTEIKRAREKTEQSNLKLFAYTKELEELAFVVSHSLRESARNISTYTGLFSREVGEQLSAKGKIYLSFMNKASLRTSEMLGDLEIYVGIGNHLPEAKPINLNQVWENVLKAKQSEVEHLNIQVKKDNLPMISGHAAPLELLFTQLLDNSIKYRKGDSLELSITYTQDKDCHHISFTDNGIGFSEVYKEKIFRVFQRLHSQEEIPGTGIGLPIIDKVVRLYGGKTDANSEEGKGATFILSFPGSRIAN